MRLDFPAPLGPMMDVKFLNGPITWCPLIVEEVQRCKGVQYLGVPLACKT